MLFIAKIFIGVILLLNSFKLILFVISTPAIGTKVFFNIVFSSLWIASCIGLLKKREWARILALGLSFFYLCLFLFFSVIFLFIDKQVFLELFTTDRYLFGLATALFFIFSLHKKRLF